MTPENEQLARLLADLDTIDPPAGWIERATRRRFQMSITMTVTTLADFAASLAVTHPPMAVGQGMFGGLEITSVPMPGRASGVARLVVFPAGHDDRPDHLVTASIPGDLPGREHEVCVDAVALLGADHWALDPIAYPLIEALYCLGAGLYSDAEAVAAVAAARTYAAVERGAIAAKAARHLAQAIEHAAVRK